MRIYLACLASYNAGKLHGVWVDATQGIEHIRDELAAMLRESPEPNIMVPCPACMNGGAQEALAEFHNGADAAPEMAPCGCFKCVSLGQRLCDTCNGMRQVPSAEEFAIHDYEDFGPWSVSEFESLETVAAVAEAAEQEGPAFLAWYAEDAGYWSDVNAAVDAFRDAYCGEYRSEVEYAEQLADDLGGLPEGHFLQYYIDYDAFARDLFINDYHSVDAPGGVYVFRRS